MSNNPSLIHVLFSLFHFRQGWSPHKKNEVSVVSKQIFRYIWGYSKMKYLYKLIMLEKVNLFPLSVIMNTDGSSIARGFFLNRSFMSSSVSSLTTSS